MNHPPPRPPVDLAALPPDDRDRAWLEQVYQGDDAVQLTPRAVVTGMLIGGLMSVSNLYVGLKIAMPSNLTGEEKELIARLGRLRQENPRGGL